MFSSLSRKAKSQKCRLVRNLERSSCRSHRLEIGVPASWDMMDHLKSFFPLNVDIMNRGEKKQKQLNFKQSPRITILIRSMKRYAFDPREYRSLRWAFEFGSCGNIQIHYFISFKISTFKYIPKCWFFVGKLALPWQEQILPTSELGSCDLVHSLTTTFEQDMKISFFFIIHKAM